MLEPSPSSSAHVEPMKEVHVSAGTSSNEAETVGSDGVSCPERTWPSRWHVASR